MKLIVLMENSSAREELLAEHGLCLYIETSERVILSDTGASDASWENAARLGVDLKKVDMVVLSHGHYDHSGGILGFVKQNTKAKIYLRKSALQDYYHGERYIGVDQRIRELKQLCYVEDEYTAAEGISLFSNIKGRRNWPKGNLELSEYVNGEMLQDEFLHEQCLVIRESGKYTLISGCAHNGILNILDRFREIYACDPDIVLSGFHMKKKTEYTDEEIQIIQETARELAKMKTKFYTGHCTGEKAFSVMSEIMKENLFALHAGDTYIL